MSETTIDSLPEEVLVEIFKMVDQESLKNVVLTCKDWKHISERSISWSLYLRHFNESGVDESWKDILLITNRKFHRVKLTEALMWAKNNTLAIFKRLGQHIQELILDYCVFDDLDIFMEFLNALPNIKRLVLNETASMVCFDDISKESLPPLSKLKTLEMLQSGYPVLKTLQNAEVTTLKVLDSCDGIRESPKPLLDFLEKQKDLQTLAFRSFYHGSSKLFESSFEDKVFQFKLKSLSLQGIKLQESPNEYNNLLWFMKKHSKTIEDLDLGRMFPDFVYEFVFAKFTNLKKLRLMVGELPTQTDFFDRLEENKSVTCLTLVDSSPENWNTVSKELFKHLPNIETLSIMNYCENETLEYIASNLKQLKNLTLSHFNNLENIKFPTLTTLKIRQGRDVTDWNALTSANSGITNLILAGIDVIENNDIDSITKNMKGLRSLTIESRAVIEPDFFNKIRENCSCLKSLKIQKQSIEEDGIVSEDFNLPVYTICQDESLLLYYDSSPEGDFWDQKDYNGNIPSDDFNWPPEDFDPDMMDPFDLELLMGDLEYELNQDDDYDEEVEEFDEFEDYDDGFD